MADKQKKTISVLITGASVGLGLSVAKRLLKSDDYHLILTARSESLVRFAREGIVESEKVWIRPMDILDRDERRTVMTEINKRLGGLDVLVNNAGFTFRSVLEHVQQNELLQQMITNFWAPMELVRLALPQMRARRQGKIINISSVGGMMAMPTMSVYNASKFALEGASESLFYEVRPWNISVTLVEPGFINSASFKKVRYTNLSGSSVRNPAEPYHRHYRFMAAFIERIMQLSPATPEAVARTIERIIRSSNPPLRVPATPDAHIFDLMRRFFPRRLYHWILYRNLPRAHTWGSDPSEK